MRNYSIVLMILVAVAFVTIAGVDGFTALGVAVVGTFVAVSAIRWNNFEVDFLVDVFLIALVARLAFGIFLHIFDLREFFGGDAQTFDSIGYHILEVWNGRQSAEDPYSLRVMGTSTPGWGIHYMTAVIYAVLGRNILAAQTFVGVLGAATAPLLYVCSFKMFGNHRVSRVSSLLVAIFPAFIVWSGQLMKDGVTIFFLVLAMTMVLVLQEKLNYVALAVLGVALVGIIAFRFYIFYMVVVAVAGSLVIGRQSSLQGLVRGMILLGLIGVTLTYVGVLRTASENLDKFGSLEVVQRSRSDLAKQAESSFAGDTDVSTTEGAISTIPLGFAYLMFAPFPWSAASLRQSIAVPETLVWWAMIPFLISGLLYTVKNKLRPALAVTVFSVMLTIAYSIFQGNVGTAYRQRTQIQVFLFIFVGVGWTLFVEKRENRAAERKAKIRRLEERLRNARAYKPECVESSDM